MFNARDNLRNELAKQFIDSLIKDSKSIYHNMEYTEVLEYIINNNITFDIDEVTENITEKKPDGIKKDIFEKNHKNNNSIKHIKKLKKEQKKGDL